MTKFLNISTDGTLTGNSDSTVVSEKAIKTYVDGSIPTVNNATITITQGGVTKGSFTLNQASGDTIALDAGGGGGSSTLAALSDVTITSPSDGQVLTYDNGDWVNADATGGYHPGLLSWEWDDHIRNDVQWLRADTFSWQDGSVYQAAYNHLVDDIDGKTTQTETIAGTTVTFYLADDGHKICPVSQESNAASIYAATGIAWYYIIDTINTRFKLPRSATVHGKLFTSGTNEYGWYRIYTDGWCEQGGTTGNANTNTVTLPITMPTTSYTVIATEYSNSNSTGGYTNPGIAVNSKTTNSFQVRGIGGSAFSGNVWDWMVTGYITALTDQYNTQCKHLYFYVGEFTQTALENTAGLNASLFNGKADIDASNFSATGKENIVNLAIPDYANFTTGSASANTYIQCSKTSFVVVWGGDPYTENYYAYVSPDNGTTKYIVGRRYDDYNGSTQETTFSFIVPAGWYFTVGAESGFTYYIYPLKGVSV